MERGSVSKKHRQGGLATLSLADVRKRAERAAEEGRYQQALELAKQIHKEEPTPANKQYLLKTYLGRARQLRERGYERDAANVLRVALGLGDQTSVWLEEAARELAACGDATNALAVTQR